MFNLTDSDVAPTSTPMPPMNPDAAGNIVDAAPSTPMPPMTLDAAGNVVDAATTTPMQPTTPDAAGNIVDAAPMVSSHTFTDNDGNIVTIHNYGMHFRTPVMIPPWAE